MSAQTQTAMQVANQQMIQQWKSPEQIQARITAINKLMSNVLREGVDYGIIPGMPIGTKPSLWKSGSEQILSMFSLAAEPIVEDLPIEDGVRYRVTVRVTNTDGTYLGSGVGEASSDETKYKWKRTYSKAEFEYTPADRRRIKYGQRRDGNQYVDYEEMQVRQEPADVANTVLKIAKKRAQIDATLTVTGASKTFTQDLDEDVEEAAPQHRTRGKKTAPAPTGNVRCNECGAVNGHLPSCKYRKPQEGKSTVEPGQEGTEPEKSKSLTWLVNVEAIDARTKVEKDKKGEHTRHFRVLTCRNITNEQITLYAFHMFERLDKIKPDTKCIFSVKPQETGGRMFYAIDSIIEITGEKKSDPAQGELLQPHAEEEF